MLKKIIFLISIISLICLTLLILQMMPIIFSSSWQGILFLSITILLLVLELYLVIKEKKLIEKSWIYNSLLIMVTIYLNIVYYKIYSIKTLSSSLYSINLSYCKNNYLILSISLIFIILNIIFTKYVNQKRKEL